MSFSNLQLTLNYSGQPNVSSTLVTSDYASAAAAVQGLAKNGGYWTNSTTSGVNDRFIPVSSILFVTVS
jgi:hypothetical protein